MLREYLQKIEIFFLSYKSTWYFRYPQILGIIVDSSILFIKVDNFWKLQLLRYFLRRTRKSSVSIDQW